MLVLDRVGKTYGNGVNALARFTADIGQGEIVAIIGGSGCGKSTLLRAIPDLDRATSGTVTLDDAVITTPHAKIGIIFQEPRLLPGSALPTISASVCRMRRHPFAARKSQPRWRGSVSPTRPPPGRANYPAGRCSGWRLRARWCSNSPLFDNFKRRVMTALDRSLDRNVPDAEPKTTTGETMWW
jgi:hypothetical protein